MSGYAYDEWRGSFYPPDLPARERLAFAASRFDSIELNGTFYSLKSPAVFARWAREAARPGFVFAIKGSRFITHTLKLAHAEGALATFYASGVLALGAATGPFLWQLPPSLRFDPARLEAFLALLPRDSIEAARLAKKHDPAHLQHGALLSPAARAPYRHAIEPRHPSFFVPAFFELLERRGVALVIADTAETFPSADRVTADFVYVRLHGSQALYASRYDDAELAAWAARIRAWASPPSRRDVYVYFDNTAHGHAPHDAARLAQMVRAPSA